WASSSSGSWIRPSSAGPSACLSNTRRSAPLPSATLCPTSLRHRSSAAIVPSRPSSTAAGGRSGFSGGLELLHQALDLAGRLAAGVVPADVGHALGAALEQRRGVGLAPGEDGVGEV